MKVLVACEFSGIVRDAFIKEGHDAMSCDLLPTEQDGPHYQGDIRDIIYSQHFDLMIAHPPCTYLTNAGVRHLHSIPSRNGVITKINGAARFKALKEGADFFNELYNAPIQYIAVENPIPSRYALNYLVGNYTQIISPWEFGDDETKRVCLWLKNLTPLQKSGKDIAWWAKGKVKTISPSPDRWKERSRFFPGIAAAMAEQWGQLDV